MQPQGEPEAAVPVLVGNGNPNMNGFLSGPLAKFAMVQQPFGSGGFGSLAHLVGANQRLKFRYDTQQRQLIGNPDYDETGTFKQYLSRPASGSMQISYSVGGASGGLIDTRYIRGGQPAVQVQYRERYINIVGGNFWPANSPLPPGTRYYEAADLPGLEEYLYDWTHTLEGQELVNPPEGTPHAPDGYTDEWWRKLGLAPQFGNDPE